MNAREFFAELFGPYERLGYVVLRAFQPKHEGNKRLRWFAADIEEALHILQTGAAGQGKFDWYFGVLPRAVRDDHKGAVQQAAAIWVDVDDKDTGGHDESLSRFMVRHSGIMPPTILVDSAGGFHGYWLLEAPHNNIGDIEAINKAISSRIGGDKTFNCNRILRVPGTLNHKRGEPRLCRVVSFTGQRFSLDYFDDLCAEGRELLTHLPGARAARGLQYTPIDPYTLNGEFNALPKRWQELLLHGVSADYEGRYTNKHGQPDRSALELAGCLVLMSLGLDDDQVAGVLANPAYGLGEKSREMLASGRGQYVFYTIQRARALYDSRST